MSEKVVITKEQAEAIERLKILGFTNEDLLQLNILGVGRIKSVPIKYNGLPVIIHMDTKALTVALYVEYEVEQTPEEKVLHQYQIATEIANESADKFNCYHQGQVDAIEMVLRTLKIEIEGIHI